MKRSIMWKVNHSPLNATKQNRSSQKRKRVDGSSREQQEQISNKISMTVPRNLECTDSEEGISSIRCVKKIKRSDLNEKSDKKEYKRNVQMVNKIKTNETSDNTISTDFVKHDCSQKSRRHFGAPGSHTERKRRAVNNKKLQLKAIRLDEESRTIFVGNIPHSASREKVKKFFKKYGNVEKIRLRGAVRSGDGKVPKKVTMMKKLFEENHPPLISYVTFTTKEHAFDALQANGVVFMDHHLRVNLANVKSDIQCDKDKCIFLGNLPFNVKEEEVWNAFTDCGDVDSVRIIRDSETGVGKGFGYVNFKSTAAVELALRLDGMKIGNREIRIKRSNLRQSDKKPKILKANPRVVPKKNKGQKLSSFRGSAVKPSVGKKKKKLSNQELKKKILAKKLAPKIG